MAFRVVFSLIVIGVVYVVPVVFEGLVPLVVYLIVAPVVVVVSETVCVVVYVPPAGLATGVVALKLLTQRIVLPCAL